MSVSIPVLRKWAEEIENAKDKGAVLAEMMGRTDWGRGKCYRELGRVGYVSGRKRRSDIRSTKADEEMLHQVSALLLESVKKNGVQTMSVKTARSIVESNGIEVGISDGRLRELLRARHMDGVSLQKEGAYRRLRSLHPNHVHEVDPSLCVLYYTPGGEQVVMHAREMHRNKFEGTAKRMRGKKLWRYVLTDHYSGSVVCRYYEASGETQSNMWDFLLYAWSKKRIEGYVMHGVPKVLLWDAGSANTSRAVQRALKMLEVESKMHMPGNPRSKGQVENANRLVERHFESLLHRSPARHVEELNASVEWFCSRWNNNTLDYFESAMVRGDKKGLVRSELWLSIRGEELRLLPDEAVCRGLLTHEGVKRKVGGDLSISYKHPRQKERRIYSLREVPGVYRGGKVEVMPKIMDEEAVQVAVIQLNGSVVKADLKPVAFDEAGFEVAAPVIGEAYKRVRTSDAEEARKCIEGVELEGLKTRELLVGGAYGGSARVEGSVIEVENEGINFEEVRKSVVEVVRDFKRRYPQWWHERAYEMLKVKYPNGMNEVEEQYEERVITGMKERYEEGIETMQKLAMIGAAALVGASGKDRR